MNNYSFYEAEQVRPLYNLVVPAYQQAFAGWPWREVSKCVDAEVRCTGGFSALAVGHYCETCGLCTEKPAYGAQELRNRFDQLGDTRPVNWFVEGGDGGLNLFALAWKATAAQVAEEKYADVPAMKGWLQGRFGDEPIIWLDDAFADKDIQPRNNLDNFEALCNGFAERLGGSVLAYRTISPQMIHAAKRDFGVQPLEQVPDRRSFITIDTGGEL